MSRRSRVPGLIDPAAGTTYESEVLADNPVGYWKLDDDGTWADSSGNSRPSFTETGTVTDGGALRSPNGVGSAQFNNSLSNYLTIGSGSTSFMNLTPPMTIEAISNTDTGGGAAFHTIASYEIGIDGSSNRAWSIYFENGRVGVFKRVDKWLEGTAASISNNTTYHVVVIFHDLLICELYLNGVQNKIEYDANTYDTSVTAPLNVGMSYAGTGSPALTADGETSDLAIYDTALSPERILRHAQAAGLA